MASSGSERYLDRPAAAALDRLRAGSATPYLDRSVVFDIGFVAANKARDVQHGMGAIPTGFVVLAVQGGNVQCATLASWTPSLAFLIADTAGTRVRGYFVVTEVPINA
jgi:hypothetical protein